MSYLKYIIYFSLSTIDSVINLLCSLVYYYPGMDFASSFLTKTELGRVYRMIQGRNDEREEKSQKALKDIKDISNGTNVS